MFNFYQRILFTEFVELNKRKGVNIVIRIIKKWISSLKEWKKSCKDRTDILYVKEFSWNMQK